LRYVKGRSSPEACPSGLGRCLDIPSYVLRWYVCHRSTVSPSRCRRRSGPQFETQQPERARVSPVGLPLLPRSASGTNC
jgi:hypothetical protein